MKSETKAWIKSSLVIAATLALGLAIVLDTPRYSAAVNNAWGIVKGVNGTWPIISCGSGSTPQVCTEHWVIGSGSQDPPAGYGDNGDLFWRTDLLAFRTKTAGVWGTVALTGGSETLSGTMSADRYEATNGGGSASNALFDVGIGSTHTGMFRGTNQGVGFTVNSSAVMQCYLSGTSRVCGMPTTLTDPATSSFEATSYTYNTGKTLTEGSATSFARIASTVFNGGTLYYCIVATDATTGRQMRCGHFNFAYADTAAAGTETCVLSPVAPDQTNDGNAGALTTGTLTYTFSTDTATPTDGCDLRVNATSSLTQIAFAINWQISGYQGLLVTPLP